MFSTKTIIKRECAKDRKISIAIMSPFFVLMAQFFVLYYFNIINTNMGQMVQLLSKATVGLFFIQEVDYKFPYSINNNRGIRTLD